MSYKTTDPCAFCGEPLGDRKRQGVVFICPRNESLCPEGHDWTRIGHVGEPSTTRYCVRCGRTELTPPTL